MTEDTRPTAGESGTNEDAGDGTARGASATGRDAAAGGAAATTGDLSDLAARVAERAVHLSGTAPGTGSEDLAPLRDALGAATVVGLGEPTHGSREVFRTKHRLLRYLVEDCGCRVFAMEANVAEARTLAAYVQGAAVDPREGLADLYFWTWQVESVLAVFEYLRAFNEGRPPGDRVRFHGIDCQYTAGAAGALRAFLADVDPAALDGRGETFDVLATDDLAAVEMEPDRHEGFASDLAAAEDLVAALEARFGTRRAAYEDATDARTVALRRQDLRALGQALAHTRASYEGDLADQAAVRDRAMAENVAWALDVEDADRVAVWAHDSHLKRVDREKEWGTVPGLGTHLADRYGEAYYALGFDFASGAFQAVTEVADGEYDLRECTLGPPPADAATRVFDAAGDAFVLDLAAATDDSALAEYFASERALRSLGAVYYGPDAPEKHNAWNVLPAAFDGVAFISETTRARPLDDADGGGDADGDGDEDRDRGADRDGGGDEDVNADGGGDAAHGDGDPAADTAGDDADGAVT